MIFLCRDKLLHLDVSLNKIKENLQNPSLTFPHTPPLEHSSSSSSSSVCSGLLPVEVKSWGKNGRTGEDGEECGGRILLHFIRKLIWRLFNWILCPSSPLSALFFDLMMSEDAERPGVSDVVQFGLLHITLFKLTSVQFSSACRIHMSVICFYFLCLYNRLPACLSVTPVWSPPPPSCRSSPAVGGGVVWVEEEQLVPARKH